jgi:hypothetical protein
LTPPTVSRTDVVAALPAAPDSAAIAPPVSVLPRVVRDKAARPKRATPPRLAALPPFSAVPRNPASEPLPITVMRGRPVRYAQSEQTEPVSATPAIRVMRPSRFVPRGPRILHVQD